MMLQKELKMNKEVVRVEEGEQDFNVKDENGKTTRVATFYKDTRSICFRNGFRIRIATLNKIFQMLKQQGEI